MQNQPEHRNGWRTQVDADGHIIRVEACHYTSQRMTRGHEMVRNLSRGQPHRMVAETDYAWAVIYEGQRVCTLKQYPNGVFHAGQHVFRGHAIEQAAVDAVRVMAPGLLQENSSGMKI